MVVDLAGRVRTGYILTIDASFTSMTVAAGLSFESPALLAVAGAVVITAVCVVLLRRPVMPALSRALFVAGAILFALAAGGLTWVGPRAGRVVVMIDESSSTRTATFHDDARLKTRVAELLGRTAYAMQRMSSADARETVFQPPPTDAIVLFSDARFGLPATAPPTYVVVDPALEEPDDSAIERVEVRDGGVVAVRARITSQMRTLEVTGVEKARVELPIGRSTVTSRVAPAARSITASVRGNDPWPENDGLSVDVPPPLVLERWWVGSRGPGDGWRRVDPSSLPAGGSEYLAAGVVVLDNVPAEAINRRLQECLEQYVRELGGGLVIVGGEHAFAAGGYPGSAMENLSPLASTPPNPMTHWVILGDSSGSMAAGIGDNSRWDFAARAIRDLLPHLPQDDSISMGNFARVVRWWRSARAVRDVQGFIPPLDVNPSGPTNLGPVLEQLAQNANETMPTRVLLITDAQTKIENADVLAQRLRKANVRVDLLGAGEIPEKNVVRSIVDATGGTVLAQDDPRQWSVGLRMLLRRALPPLLGTSPLQVTFTDAGLRLPPLAVSEWNRTWLKSDVTELATGQARGERVPAIGAGFAGNGAVIAVAFNASIPLATALADRAALPPRDPRFTITWDSGAKLAVRLDAVEGGNFVNDLAPRLVVKSADGRMEQRVSLTQQAPGGYEASIESPSHPAFALLYVNGQLIDRISVTGRYAPEFDAIGNDRRGMENLAKLTGGAVIEPDQLAPIDFRWPVRRLPLMIPFGVAGLILLAGGLVCARRRG